MPDTKLPGTNTITGTLINAELVMEKMIRYQFKDQTLDLEISVNDSYEHRILEASILVNIPVTLSYTTLTNNIPVLLDISYPRYTHSQQIQEAALEDKKKVFYKGYRIIGIAAAIGVAFITFVGIMEGSLDKVKIPFIFFSLVFIILIVYILSKMQPVQNATEKLVIRTTITEIFTIVADGKDDEEPEKTYYRLANGILVDIAAYGFRVQDKVRIQFLVQDDGSRGELIDMVKI